MTHGDAGGEDAASKVGGVTVDCSAAGSSVTIRLATFEDADSVVTVLRRSIAELCVADHYNDPDVLGAWLANKTVANAQAWIQCPRNFMVIADAGAAASSPGGISAADPASAVGVCGVASMSITGTVLLCYVLPEVQSSGVGRALLASLEAEARRRGLREVSLESTVSARGFYFRHGYLPRSNDPPDSPLLCKVVLP